METSDDLYNQILTNGPSPKTLFLLLSRLKDEGQLRRVIQESIKALDVYPNDVHIRRLLAEAYFESGSVSQAETELEKVATLIGDLIPSYKLQAQVYGKQGKEEKALEALKLYLAHRPNDQEALHLLDTLRPVEEPPVAEPQPRIEPVSGPIEEVMEEESFTAAEEALSEIATPTLAEIYFNQGQIKEAIDTYEMFIEQNPGDEGSKQRLKELKAMMEDTPIEGKGVDKAREKKKKMIAILEGWLANIQNSSKSP